MHNTTGLRRPRRIVLDNNFFQKDTFKKPANDTVATNVHNQTSNTSSNMDYESQQMIAVSAVVVALLIMAFFTVFKVRRWRRSNSAVDESTQESVPADKAKSEHSIEERRTQIESSLINIMVREHDFNCPVYRQNLCETSYVKDEESSADTEVLPHGNIECPICMEPFKVGESISISNNNTTSSQCTHSYHHSCIVSWLILHDTCPTCRALMTTIKEGNNKTQLASSDTKSVVAVSSTNTSFFCVSHGIDSTAKQSNG